MASPLVPLFVWVCALTLACADPSGKENDEDEDTAAEAFIPEEGRWKVTSSEVSDAGDCDGMADSMVLAEEGTRVDLALEDAPGFTLQADGEAPERCAFEDAGESYDCDPVSTTEESVTLGLELTTETVTESSGLFRSPTSAWMDTDWDIDCSSEDCERYEDVTGFEYPCRFTITTNIDVY